MTSDKRSKTAHRLLGLYWLHKIANGSSVTKATLKTLAIETDSVKKEYRGRLSHSKSARVAAALTKAGKPESKGSTKTGKTRGAATGRLFRTALKKARII